ncbi:MAG: HupE/UreJ family protein [Candidatus Scalindua sp.]|nr:HupE/UreJ family protein [Candidatus Scalindua sp.]
MKCTLFVIFFLLTATAAIAHELRPAYLELYEEKSDEFSVLWKTPMRGDMRLSLSPEFSGKTENITPPVTRITNDAAVATWRLKAIEPLRGQSVRIDGLERTMNDALVRMEFMDGSTWVKRLTSMEPSAVILSVQSSWLVALEYLKLGIEHILLGIDHLLFVLALLIITRGTMRLVKTISAFTVAHSVTLGLTTIGFVQVPSKPVEAVIALSIVFVAVEIIYFQRGKAGVTVTAPWVVAFSFGLLHGFGFAGALSEVGLPAGHIPAALLFFNIGVETGQLLFVAVIMSFLVVLKKLNLSTPRWVVLMQAYTIGSIAMFWVIQRISAF